MKRILFILLGIMISFPPVHLSAGATLKELYKSGTLRLTEQEAITMDSVPDDVTFKSFGRFALGGKKGDRVFLTDIRAHNLKIFDTAGKFVKVLGRKGSGPGDFNRPVDIAYNHAEDLFFIWEIGNRRYSFFDSEGQFVKVVKVMKRMMIKKIRCLKNGDVIIENELYNYGQNIGQERVISLYSADLTKKRELYRHKVLTNKFVIEPVRMNIPQPFQPLVSWDVTGGRLVVGFQDNYNLDFYGLTGKKSASFSHKYTRIPVTDKDKKKFFEEMTVSFNGGKITRGAPKYVRDKTSFPKNKPVFSEIITDPEGNILVLLPGTEKNKVNFDAFEPGGEFIARVTVEVEGKIFMSNAFFEGKNIWMLSVGEDDEQALKKFKLSGL